MSRKVDWTNLNDWIERYLSGVSLKRISDEIGISRRTLERKFRICDVVMRGRSDAERLKWKGIRASGNDAILRQIGAAWRTRRDGTDSIQTRLKRARTRERLKLGMSAGEFALYDCLVKYDIRVLPQRAFGPYNID